ncbi:MAG: TraR/DksA C4-type zinc finger protein [Candidatus Nanopelagicales bacterium]
MGAGDWVAGGLRRAVAGVRSALPGVAEPVEELPATVAPDPEDVPAAKKAPVTRPAAAKPPVKRPAAPKAPATKKAPARRPATAPARKAPGEPAPGRGAPAAKTRAAQAPAAAPAPPVVLAWSDEELAAFRVALDADVVRLREELNMGQADMDALLSDSAERSGDDQADAGSKTLEREQEMSVNANANELLEQSMHALARLDAGTYGICESCGTAIPAARLSAFPRATLCIACKQSEERR